MDEQSGRDRFHDLRAEDWMAYAGCEEFSDGASPMIADLGDADVIVDRSGVGMNTYDHSHTDVYVSRLLLDDNRKAALTLAALLADRISDASSSFEIAEALDELGFTPLERL